MRFGHILVVDEADKAPTNVTCILKTLVESGEMVLSDGRRIVASKWVQNILITCIKLYHVPVFHHLHY